MPTISKTHNISQKDVTNYIIFCMVVEFYAFGSRVGHFHWAFGSQFKPQIVNFCPQGVNFGFELSMVLIIGDLGVDFGHLRVNVRAMEVDF